MNFVSYNPKADFDYEEALELWKKGYTFEQLGDKYGYYKGTIKKYIRKVSGENYISNWNEHHKNYKSFQADLEHKNRGQTSFVDRST
jgi:hypothetical protein